MNVDPQTPPAMTMQEANSKKVAAGVCGILLGALGIHKFILGKTNAGLIMLLGTLLTCGLAAAVFHVIGVIEGILYLTKTDEEFYRTYIVGGKDWF
jgi:TM2 domain-containing membrane protein YozV